MYKQISVYIVLLLALIALTFFLTSYYIDSGTDPSEKDQNLNIFQAKDINLKLNFFESDLSLPKMQFSTKKQCKSACTKSNSIFIV